MEEQEEGVAEAVERLYYSMGYGSVLSVRCGQETVGTAVVGIVPRKAAKSSERTVVLLKERIISHCYTRARCKEFLKKKCCNAMKVQQA